MTGMSDRYEIKPMLLLRNFPIMYRKKKYHEDSGNMVVHFWGDTLYVYVKGCILCILTGGGSVQAMPLSMDNIFVGKLQLRIQMHMVHHQLCDILKEFQTTQTHI